MSPIAQTFNLKPFFFSVCPSLLGNCNTNCSHLICKVALSDDDQRALCYAMGVGREHIDTDGRVTAGECCIYVHFIKGWCWFHKGPHKAQMSFIRSSKGKTVGLEFIRVSKCKIRHPAWFSSTNSTTIKYSHVTE